MTIEQEARQLAEEIAVNEKLDQLEFEKLYTEVKVIVEIAHQARKEFMETLQET